MVIDGDLVALETLLQANRRLQTHLRERIDDIAHRLASMAALIRALRAEGVRPKIVNRTTPLMRADQDIVFKFYYCNMVYAPPLFGRLQHNVLPLLSKPRWGHRAVQHLKRQADCLGLGANAESYTKQWHTVADALNYDSSRVKPVSAFQCYLHFRHTMATSQEPFSHEEDVIIYKHVPEPGMWKQLERKILEKCGRRRSAFQLAGRHQKLLSCDYQCTDFSEDVLKQAVSLIDDDGDLTSRALIDFVMKLNAGHKLPWVTVEAIARAARDYGQSLLTEDEHLRRSIHLVLLSDADYTTSSEAKALLVRTLHWNLMVSNAERFCVKYRYSQISLEEAANRLSSSVSDVRNRILSAVLLRHNSVYNTHFANVSMTLFGNRDAAMICFVVSREYERSRKRMLPSIRIHL
ncbi:uncharacterized protein TEOVI_000660400 [Trypanosoma equiperdum]|uniref:Uncharacterized protein n=2 Tax=Trypanozoon TaxID=39700 RepID=Q57UT8_TRYB2|nr:hypothetical protein, conserved [Trypanosoma brucei brucei TREU927]AAX70639.1 hypothetical protein, conserved [Trypanosoma brucei]AAZ10628.1 hypothetical protein, conserved [Trypanosoma brucei brucei TREU927]SCU67316.1 hypothetical protein, conserved [Trypanosoma equiperdum]